MYTCSFPISAPVIWISRAHSLSAVISAENEMLKENKQLEQGMKEILQAIQEAQSKAPTQTAISIPSLERLVSVSDLSFQMC